MAEFVGTENQIAVQKRMRDRQSWIAETPGAVNGGRVMAFDDPGRVGWDRVTELANEDKLAVFPMFPESEILDEIRNHLGPQWKTPSWQVYLGTPETVLPACGAVIGDNPLPPGWRMAAYEGLDDRQVEAVQDLNTSTGVSPYPAFFMRGDAVPVLTACISDDTGTLMATASAAMRYHAESRLGGYVFAGMASVSPDCRGRGHGKVINAYVLAASHARLGWTMAKEQVSADNPVSQAMLTACGLSRDEVCVSVAAINSEEGFTR